MDFETINVFISSSFSDMHAERDYLVEYVFPELREWCEKRRLYLNDIDLRWGVSSADSESNNTIRVCLKGIDDCRPFFLCFLGQRRGTVFGRERISKESIDQFPELEEMGDIYSATELEIEHALLSPMLEIVYENHTRKKIRREKARRALFFLRDDPFGQINLSDIQKKIYTNAGAKDPQMTEQKHREFRELVRKECRNVTDYQCRFDRDKITPELRGFGVKDADNPPFPPAEQGRLTDFTAQGEALKDVIIRQLKEMILKEYPDRKDESPDAALSEADLQSLTKARFMQFFVEREGAYDDLKGYLSSGDSSVFILSAQSGAGKSTLLSNFANTVKDFNVIMRFCGISQNSLRFTDVLRGIFEENGISLLQDDKSFTENLDTYFCALGDRGKTLFILDDITKTAEGIHSLELLPKMLPKNIKLVVSLRETSENIQFVKAFSEMNHAQVARIKAFDAKDKELLIKNFLSNNLKSLDQKQIDYLCDLEYTNNPLYMKIILKELRTFGIHRELLTEIERFGKNPEDAFSHLLERLEQKVYDSFADMFGAVNYLFGLLCFSRAGVKKSDIRALMLQKYAKPCDECTEYILKCPRDYLSGVVFADTQSKVDFLYDSFKRASQSRCRDDEKALRNALASVFEFSDPEECSYQLRMAGNTEKLRELYADPAFLTRFCTLNGGWKLIREIDLIDEGIVSKEVLECVHICAQALTRYPEKAPQIFYKEVTDPVFREKAKKLIFGRWLRFEPTANKEVSDESEDEEIEVVPCLENRYQVGSHMGVRCFAAEADLAFVSLKVRELSVFRMSTAELIGTIRIDDDSPHRILSSGDGKYLAIVSGSFEIRLFELIRNDGSFMLKPVFHEECMKIRFKGACAYAVKDAIIWQTRDRELKAYQNGGVRSLGENDNLLEGVWQCDQLMQVFRESGEHILRCGEKSLSFDAPVNDMILWNGSLYIAVRDCLLYIVDPASLTIKSAVKTDNPLYCFAVCQSMLIATDEEFNLEQITKKNSVNNLGNINYSNGSVNTYAFEYIRNCQSGVFYCSDSVCAKLKLKEGEQTHAKERFFNAVKEEDRKKVFDTFEGKYMECHADGIDYKIEQRSILAAYTPDGRRIGSSALDESLTGGYIIKPVGSKAAVLTLRARKTEGSIAVVRCVIAVYDGASLKFRKEYMPDDNIIGMYIGDDSIWLRGSNGFTVINCADGFTQRNVPFDFSGFPIHSPAIVTNSTPVMFRDSTHELCVISGETGEYLATFPLSRTIDSLECGNNGILCIAKEHGTDTYQIILEEDKNE